MSKNRIAIFTSSCCTGWCYGYEADDVTQAMIKKHAEKYNSVPAWQARNQDGSVTIYDSLEDAIAAHNKDADEDEQLELDQEELYDYYANDGDGETVNAAWIVHRLLCEDWWMETCG
jgi:hypothetical protein